MTGLFMLVGWISVAHKHNLRTAPTPGVAIYIGSMVLQQRLSQQSAYVTCSM